jgi:hypothetical protein
MCGRGGLDDLRKAHCYQCAAQCQERCDLASSLRTQRLDAPISQHHCNATATAVGALGGLV